MGRSGLNKTINYWWRPPPVRSVLRKLLTRQSTCKQKYSTLSPRLPSPTLFRGGSVVTFRTSFCRTLVFFLAGLRVQACGTSLLSRFVGKGPTGTEVSSPNIGRRLCTWGKLWGSSRHRDWGVFYTYSARLWAHVCVCVYMYLWERKENVLKVPKYPWTP